MASPVCPPGYVCDFTPVAKPQPFHPWWEGPWPIVLTAAAIIAFVLAVWIVSYYWNERKAKKQQMIEGREQREQARFIEEQRTMQLDSAKGNPEAIKIIREMQRGY